MATERLAPHEVLGASIDEDVIRRAGRSIVRYGAHSPLAATITAKPALPEPSAPSAVGGATLPGQPDLDVLRLLGAGGMGQVLLARQPSLQREVAVKTVRPEILTAETSMALLEESRITGSLEHPNIVPVHSLGVDALGRPFLVMKRVDGVAWSDLLRDAAHPAWDRLKGRDDRLGANLRVLLSVCDAVQFAHRRGVVHRDIKPENVMIGEFGEVYLVDWGVATALDRDDPRYRKERLALVGTPCHMAPEMVADDGGEVDARTDVYLIGATLHYVLTGAVRHAAGTLIETLNLAYQSPPASYPATVPAAVAEIANRACAREPAERYPSAAALRGAIAEYLEHRGSNTLSGNARVRLEALQGRWLALGGSVTAEARARMRVELGECKLGFAHALDVWAENPQAREGLRACARLALRDEIAAKNLVGAEAARLEAGEVPEEIEAALQALRDEEQAQRALAERYRARAQGEDWSRAAGARVAFFVGVALMGVVLWLWTNGGQVRVRGALPPERLAVAYGIALVWLSLMIVASRRWLMATEVNARLVYGLLMTVAANLIHRVANLWPVSYTASLVSTELIFCGLASALGGLTLARWLWIQVPFWLAGAAAARIWPELAGLWFACAGLLCLFIGMRMVAPGREPPR